MKKFKLNQAIVNCNVAKNSKIDAINLMLFLFLVMHFLEFPRKTLKMASKICIKKVHQIIESNSTRELRFDKSSADDLYE